ncbi:MAG: hypothetical protein AAGG02_15720 [Cyanobacteria bacterium P01_H01_bin.15]
MNFKFVGWTLGLCCLFGEAAAIASEATSDIQSATNPFAENALDYSLDSPDAPMTDFAIASELPETSIQLAPIPADGSAELANIQDIGGIPATPEIIDLETSQPLTIDLTSTTQVPIEWQAWELDSTNYPLAQASDIEIEIEPAAEEDAETSHRNWTLNLTPYAFVPFNLSGDTSIAGVEAELDAGLGDILSALSFNISGQVEAWYKDRVGLLFNAYYVNLRPEADVELENLGPFGLTTVSVEARPDVQQLYFDLAVAYRFRLDNNPPAPTFNRRQKGDTRLDVMGGIRIQYLNQTIDLDISANNAIIGDLERANLNGSLGSDNTWVEPLIGARITHALSERVGLMLRGDVSGFGIGELSVTWRTFGGVDWVFAGNTSLLAGYGVYGIDYDTGSGRDQFGLDTIQHGPFVGFTFRI